LAIQAARIVRQGHNAGAGDHAGGRPASEAQRGFRL